ncbi:MAG: 2'-5' RNA ligase family protein [Lachnospiraceae bacterium]|nr:2'-5' RNA ligase family protein [Lachnospiraceae bacterium]
MYLISIYFDDITNKKIQGMINRLADVTENTFMIDEKIPPHITLLEFETKDENEAIRIFEENANAFAQGEVLLVSIGTFKRNVIYVEPVLNKYLHNLSLETFEMFSQVKNIIFSPYYHPFSWIPHLSLGKHLTEGQLVKAFKKLINEFSPCSAKVTKISISKTNPHRDLKILDLNVK